MITHLRLGRSSGIGYRKRFIYASWGRATLIFGWGNYGEFKDAFELTERAS